MALVVSLDAMLKLPGRRRCIASQRVICPMSKFDPFEHYHGTQTCSMFGTIGNSHYNLYNPLGYSLFWRSMLFFRNDGWYISPILEHTKTHGTKDWGTPDAKHERPFLHVQNATSHISHADVTSTPSPNELQRWHQTTNIEK